MRDYEIPVASGSGLAPSTLEGGLNDTIPADTLVVARWSDAVQKLLLDLPGFGGECWVALEAETVDAEAAHAIKLDADRSRLVVGAERPHVLTKIAVRSTVDLVLAGVGKNATLLGWT